ncbi:MAG: hypothetical protein LBR07_05390 [Puniceicoccales bacterium]|nr:hypothetical protein [Puniceicoccales bacterium]
MTGTITAAWKYSDDGTRFTYTVTVPPNTTATVTLPFSRRTFPIGSGTYTWTEDVK